jgi:hypothetical protein
LACAQHQSIPLWYVCTRVYVAAEDLDRFVASFIGTFGGTASQKFVTTVTPTPSQTTFHVDYNHASL